MKDIAIKIENVHKEFRLPTEKATGIKQLLINKLKHKSSYTKQKVLDGISFEIKKGEFFGIVGRNGSGKSTLLKIIAEIYRPTSGKIKVDGKLVPFIELGVGFNSELTGRENVYLNGALLGFSEKEIDAIYEDIVDFAELRPFMDQKLKNYSSGMQVRLAFSVATRAKADILLVDEVLAVGDAEFQRKCYEYFKELKRAKKTVIFVSHDMGAIREYCDRAVLIEKSRIVKDGNVDNVAGAYSKLFIPKSEMRDALNDKEIKRWGTRSIVYSGARLQKLVASEQDSVITIITKYKVKKDIKNPIFGFSLINTGGTYIFGTNTRILKKKTGVLREGEGGEVVWKIPNILNDGRYIINIAISSHDETMQYDWWEGALSLVVYRKVHTAYIVEPTIKVEVKK
jgi:ABC-2 type transport system ATP-binding protein